MKLRIFLICCFLGLAALPAYANENGGNLSRNINLVNVNGGNFNARFNGNQNIVTNALNNSVNAVNGMAANNNQNRDNAGNVNLNANGITNDKNESSNSNAVELSNSNANNNNYNEDNKGWNNNGN
jgi:hypothetical protein